MELIVASTNKTAESQTEIFLAGCSDSSFRFVDDTEIDFSAAAILLRAGSVNVLATPLDQAPLIMPEDLAISALTDRDDPAFGLLLAPKYGMNARIFDLAPSSKIGTCNLLATVQVSELRGDLQTFPMGENVSIAKVSSWLEEDVDGFMAPLQTLAQWHRQKPETTIIRLEPSECIPAAGTGTTALITLRDDLPTRRMLKPCHKKEVAFCTNVERQITKLANNAGIQIAGAWCTTDNDRNVHAHALICENQETEPKYARVSSVTSTGLADLVWQHLGVI